MPKVIRPLLLLCLALTPPLGLAQNVAAEFERILGAHVSDGMVDYPALQGNRAFADYLRSLAQPQRLDTREAKLVVWMNAYNAFAMQGILDGLSPSSFFGRLSFFRNKTYTLNGAPITLHDLEHKLLRPLGEPRIHFSIVCASRSCPKQRSDAYRLDNLEQQLEDNARRFVNDSSRNRFDKLAKRAHISEIFKWFEEDFVKAAGSVPAYLARYVADPEVARALTAGEYKLSFIDYDWSLNGTPPRK